MNRKNRQLAVFCWMAVVWACLSPGQAAPLNLSLFERTNLVAWCIVPFDAKKRGPEERAAMLERLGFRQFAYDYRAEHVPTFDAEMKALARHQVRLVAWWFPATLDAEARLILDVLSRHGVKAQLWVTGGGEPAKDAEDQRQKVKAEVGRLRPIAEAASGIGCSVALYNHGGWFGEPENQIEIIQQLQIAGATNVGIVYNLHHGHQHLQRFHELLARMRPYLMALNLNGMERNGESRGRKILPLGEGGEDLRLVRLIAGSGWLGPVGILNHTEEDAEVRLKANLDGLDRLVSQLRGSPDGTP